jgi:hypothetical protein
MNRRMKKRYPLSLSKRTGTGICLTLFTCMAALLEGRVVQVATADELREALVEAVPGSVIQMEAGEWRDLDLLVRAEGSAGNPVVLEAAVPGTVRLTGQASLRLEGEHIVVRGLHFDQAVPAPGREALISFRGEDDRTANNTRLTDLYFDHCNPDDPLERYPWIRVYGHANRIDHCRFEGQNHKGLAIQVRVYDPDPAHRIDHNHFLDRLPGAESNGYEIIQIGLSGDSMKPANVVVEENIFERCDGETEIISSKSFYNVIRHNLFLDSSGTVTLRHGNKGQVINNTFIGMGKSGSGGIRVVGSGHRVEGNVFSGLTGRTGGVVVLYCGIPDSPLNGYFAASDTVLKNNIFHRNSGNAVYLNGGFGQRNRILLPENVRLEGNVFGQPAAPGIVAIAGHLADLKLSGNLYDSGMETGIHPEDGLELSEITFSLNAQGLAEPFSPLENNNLSPSPLLPAPRVPERKDVGPRWMANLPALLLLNARAIQQLRNAPSLPARDLRNSIQDQADAILKKKTLYSVTFNDRMPPSGDIRDYYSTGPYWWPNPDTPDGLPYVRRDGEFNPERDRVSDREPLHRMIRDVRLLALATALTGNQAYGDWAARLLDTWFLNEKTGMNPHLNHAQAIPGVTDGRGTGIIDTHPFAELVDAILILENNNNLSLPQAAALRAWFAAFTEWLLDSSNGLDERDSVNNHGTAYDLQAAALLWFTGQEARLKDYLSLVTLPRIGAQIERDGRQPKELSRTRTWSYCTENLEHFFKLGLIARKVDIDLFTFHAENGAGLKEALNYLMPYVCDNEAWPHEQATAWQHHFIRNVLSIASGVYDDPAYVKALECLPVAEADPFPDLLRP